MRTADIRVGELYVDRAGSVRFVADETPAWLRGRGFGVDDYICWVGCHGADAPPALQGRPIERHGKPVTGVTTRRTFASWARACFTPPSPPDTSERPNPLDYVDFADIAHDRLHQQAQYAARHLFADGTSPYLGAGLRILGALANYHEIAIHRDDVAELVRRYELMMRRAAHGPA